MHPDKSTAPIDSSIDRDIAEHDRQFREILEHCPAGLNVVDEDGRLPFHNACIRELLGYSQEEMERFDTRKFWVDLDQRARIIESLREGRASVVNFEVLWKTKQGEPIHVLASYPRSLTTAVTSVLSAASVCFGFTTLPR